MFETIAGVPGIHLYGLILGIIVSAALHLARHRRLTRRQRYEVVAMYAIGITGFHGFTSFIVHTVFADQVATSIGWAAGSPFQTEVAGANLAIGTLGFLGFWRKDMWLPYLLAKFAFAWTAGVTHVVDIAQNANFAVNNAGPIVYWDFLMPLALLALFLLQRDPRTDAAPSRPFTVSAPGPV